MIRESERQAFEAFRRSQFRSGCSDGADPPDFVCTDEQGRRIGIELAEWVIEAQLAISKRRSRIRESFEDAVRAVNADPANLGMTWLHPGALLPASSAPELTRELETCASHINDTWAAISERWTVGQGYPVRDFREYPTLNKYVRQLDFFPRNVGERFCVTFMNGGGAYSPRAAFAALLRILNKKESKYEGLRERERLDELHLVLYWSQGLAHNTPYDGLDYSLEDVAAELEPIIREGGTIFDAVFISDMPRDEHVRVWPGA